MENSLESEGLTYKGPRCICCKSPFIPLYNKNGQLEKVCDDCEERHGN